MLEPDFLIRLGYLAGSSRDPKVIEFLKDIQVPQEDVENFRRFFDQVMGGLSRNPDWFKKAFERETGQRFPIS